MDEYTDDLDKYLKENINILQECKADAFGINTMLAECGHGNLLNVVSRSVNKLNSITGGIYDFYDIKVPRTALTTRDKFQLLVNCNDALLDKLATELQEASGKKTSHFDLDGITDKSPTVLQKTSNLSQRVILPPRRIENNCLKPQQLFLLPVDNSADSPFIPILKDKPHSKKPLSVMLCVDDCGREYYNHPYSYELLHFTTPQHQLKRTSPVEPLVMEATPYILINTVKELQVAVTELSVCKEIAVDLEHHSFRSYQGLTCLLQISSRSKDYIIDPLQLRGQLDCLNNVFTNPKILKVFHGASCDILWLQRDLGVYVVNMFDTYQAALLLEYPTKSLAYLLTKFCDVTASKVYQRADWRIRPLPEDFIYYARQDTHYLLYIFDKMRNELIEKPNSNLIYSVYDRSSSICLERYDKPYVNEESHMELYSRSRVMFNSRQRFALKKLFQWRDETARKNDDSLEYTFPAHMMLQVSEQLPKYVQGILALCNPVPTAVKEYQIVLHNIIQEAGKSPLEEVENILFYQKPEKTAHSFELKMDLISKFDFSHIETNPTGLSTILNDTFEPNASYTFRQNYDNEIVLKEKSNMFIRQVKIARRPVATFKCQFNTPFQRYKTMLSIQELLDESRQNSKSKSDETRVAEVLDFLGKISKPDLNTSIEEPEASECNSTQDLTSESQEQKEDDMEKPEHIKDEKVVLKQVLTENKWKLLHDEQELPENFEEIGRKRRKHSDTEEESAEFEPFDYSAANTSFLKPSRRNHKQRVQERFKAKRSQKSTGDRKSGLKSFSWGAK